MKDYTDLPKYFAGWDVGIMPFALNDATRFISPTKTPEYLSAGLPVVSTAIRDVVRPYGELGLARIADSPEDFIRAAEQAMASDMGLKWRERADEFLRSLSWDSVWNSMSHLIAQVLRAEDRKPVSSVMADIPAKRSARNVAAGETARV
jgi:UDP-galactopyranose mutase